MATKKKLLEAAAGAAGGGATAVGTNDVFGTYLWDGTGQPFVAQSQINFGSSGYGGGAYWPIDGNGNYLQTATLPAFSGAFTYELWFKSYDVGRAIYLLSKGTSESNFIIKTDYLDSSGNLYVTVAGSPLNSTAVGWYTRDWNHVAVVRDSSNNTAVFVNGTRTASNAISGSNTSEPYYIGSVSTGNAASGYELMYGYMSSVRISDTNRYDPTAVSLTVPTSQFTSDSNTVLLTCQGDAPLEDASSNAYSITVTGQVHAADHGPYTGNAGDGGMIWMKVRDKIDSAYILDTEQGAESYLASNTTGANVNSPTGLTDFNKNGFSLAGQYGLNPNGFDICAWQFKKQEKFFDLVKFTGDGTDGRTISHNLNGTVGFMFVKRMDATDNWRVWHRTQTGKYANLDLTAAFQNDTASNGVFNSTDPTSTQFTVGVNLNASGGTYIAYLFGHNNNDASFGLTGDQDIIKCGTYAGNSTDSTTINIGFEAQWLLLKRADGTQDWTFFDNVRRLPRRGFSSLMMQNNTAVEATNGQVFGDSQGFMVDAGDYNTTGENYIYIAIRRGAFSGPTKNLNSFDMSLYSGNQTANQYVFEYSPIKQADLVLYADRNVNSLDYSTYGHYWIDRVRNSRANSGTANNNFTTGWTTYYVMNGPMEKGNYALYGTQSQTTYLNNSSSNYIAYIWQELGGFFHHTQYTGTGTNQTVAHDLGAVPEMMIFKVQDSATDWRVYHVSTGNTGYLQLNGTNAFTTDATVWNNTSPTETDFYVGNHNPVNKSGVTIDAYLFGSSEGYSKCGSYTGNGGTSDIDIDMGFSSGARFIIIKEYSGTSNWFLFDTLRGIVSGGDDPFIRLDEDASSEVTTSDLLIPNSTGVTIRGVNSGINTNAATYIYYAVA